MSAFFQLVERLTEGEIVDNLCVLKNFVKLVGSKRGGDRRHQITDQNFHLIFVRHAAAADARNNNGVIQKNRLLAFVIKSVCYLLR